MFCSISVGHIVNYYYVTLYNQSVTVHLTSGAETAYPSEGSRNCLPFWREQEMPTLLKGAGTAYPSEGSRNCLPFWREQELSTLLKGAGTVYLSEGSRTVLSGVSCYSIWNFLSSILSNIVCFFILFLLVIVSSILLRIMACDYILGIFKLFITRNMTVML